MVLPAGWDEVSQGLGASVLPLSDMQGTALGSLFSAPFCWKPILMGDVPGMGERKGRVLEGLLGPRMLGSLGVCSLVLSQAHSTALSPFPHGETIWFTNCRPPQPRESAFPGNSFSHVMRY